MKKFGLLLLSILLIVSMTACAAAENTDAAVKEESVQTTQQVVEDVEESALPQEETKDPAATYDFAEITVVDNDSCTMKITDCETGGLFGTELTVYLENKTDKVLMFSWDNVSVNGYMVDPFWAEEVAAGKKSNDTITFSEDTLEECGITSLDEIRFDLRVYDSDDWLAEEEVDDTFTVYLTGKSAEQIEIPARRTTSSEVSVVEDDEIAFVILDTEVDDIWGYTVNCYLENKTDKTLMFSWDNVSVNGYMIDPFWAKEVAPGMRAYVGIDFSDSKFEENGITDVAEIEYLLKVYDSNDYRADDICEETFVYQP